jgi:hypothetical protein
LLIFSLHIRIEAIAFLWKFAQMCVSEEKAEPVKEKWEDNNEV